METTQNVLNLPAKNLIPEGFQIYTLPSTSTVFDCLKLLIEKNIYGVPLKMETTNEWIGFIEINDLVQIILYLIQERHSGDIDWSSISISQSKIQQVDYKTILDDMPQIEKQLRNLPILKVFPSRSTAWLISENATIQTVIDALMSRRRIVLLKDSEGEIPFREITGLVSRSTVIDYLAKNVQHLNQHVVDKSLDDAGIITRNVVTITDTPSHRAIDAFSKICETGTSHLAILSEQTQDFVGTISVKDIKLVLEPGSPGHGGALHLYLPLHNYISLIRQKNLKAVHPTIHASGKDTVGKTLCRFAAVKIHKLFITADSKEEAHVVRLITGVISLRDILSLFVTTPK